MISHDDQFTIIPWKQGDKVWLPETTEAEAIETAWQRVVEQVTFDETLGDVPF